MRVVGWSDDPSGSHGSPAASPLARRGPGAVPGAGCIEVGWRLAREAWGLGYATEAAKAALAVAFDELRLDEVNSITAVLNAPSLAVMVRLGMTLSDEFEHPRIAAGSPLSPHVRYLLARPEH